MELTIATQLLSFARNLFDLGGKLKEAKTQKREKISQFLMKISEALNEMVEKAESGDDISGACGEINTYMNFLMDALADHLPLDQINEFKSALGAAELLRGLPHEIVTHDDRDKILSDVREASGKFKALSNVLLL